MKGMESRDKLETTCVGSVEVEAGAKPTATTSLPLHERGHIDDVIDEQTERDAKFLTIVHITNAVLVVGVVVLAFLTGLYILCALAWIPICVSLTIQFSSATLESSFSGGAAGLVFGPELLPPGWEQRWDERRQCLSWMNAETGQVQDYPPPMLRGTETLRSRASVCVVRGGVIESKDQSIVNDPQALWTFLRLYNTPPRVKVKVHGHHTETRTKVTTDSNGNTRVETYSEEVTDFLYSLGASQAVHSLDPTIEENAYNVIEVFCSDRAKLKQLNWRKDFPWDEIFLANAIPERCRQLGYWHGQVDVQVQRYGDKIRVYRHSKLDALMRSLVARFLLLLLLPPVCMLVALIRTCSNRKYRTGATFKQQQTAQEWFAENMHLIHI